MESQSVRLEREAEETLWQLSETLGELRGRMTPGRVVDQVIDYTRDSPAAEFLRNLGREVRENPMPLVVAGIGILWLLLATNRTSRARSVSSAALLPTAVATPLARSPRRDAAGGLADKARSASTDVVTTFERAKHSISGESTDPTAPVDMDRPASRVAYQKDTYADERR